MPNHQRSSNDLVLQPLEPRRMLSFAPGPEVIVTGGSQGPGFDLAVAPDGSYLVAASVAQGEVHRVTAFRYSADGARVGEPITLYSHIPPDANSTPRISASIDADGDAVVAYRVFDGLDTGIYFSRISRTGQVSPTVRLTHFASAPVVSMDPAGRFFVGWREGQDDRFVARAFDAAGVPRGEQFLVAQGPGIGFLIGVDFDALSDGSGIAFAAARSYDSDSGHVRDTVTFGRTTTSAVLDSEEISAPEDNLTGGTVAVHADGSFVGGYRFIDGANPAIRSLFVRQFDAAGNQIGSPVQLGAPLPSGGNGTHSLALDDAPGGGFVASFVQTTGSVDTIYAARFSAAGALDESGYVPLATDAAAAQFADGRFVPEIGADARGAAVAAYVMRTGEEVRLRPLSTGESIAELRGAELFVSGTGGNDHITVERVRERVFVNVNGLVRGFAASAIQFLSVNGFGGDDDVVNATAIPATIHGGDGFDTIWGGTGPDRIRGFGGNDALHGGDGDDTLFGDAGSDLLRGGDGRDLLLGDLGEDTLLGSSDNDTLRGQRGSDRLFGEADNDVLEGGDADDYLEGGAGHDDLYGQGGRDALFGLAGNDRLFADDGAADTVRGGLGDDTGNVDDLDDVLAVESVA